MESFNMATGLVSLVALLVCLTSTRARSTEGSEPLDTGSCLSRLHKLSDGYRRCRKEQCFLFIAETLFVTVPPIMKSEEDQRLFPCSEHARAYRGLKGVSFDILRETSSHRAYCAWAGNNCTFNQMVYFMAEQAKKGYRFTTLTAMLETKKRRRISRMSTSFFEGRIVIIGPIEGAKLLGPMQTLLRPFQGAAWAIVLLAIVLFITLAFAIEWKFRGSRPSLWDVVCLLFGERGRKTARKVYRKVSMVSRKYRVVPASRMRPPSIGGWVTYADDDDCSSLHQVDSERYRIAGWTLRFALILFVTLCIIFYEAGVVNFLFGQSSAKLSKDLPSLSKTELATFGVQRDQAIEDIFRDLVNPSGILANKTDLPWYRCLRIEDCWRRVLDENDPVKYVVTFTGESEYLARMFNARSRVAIYEPEGDLYSFTTGFLHNLEILESKVMQLDLDLLDLRKAGKLRDLVKKGAGPPLTNAGKAAKDIGWAILGLPFFIFVMPLVVIIVVCLVLPLRNSRENELPLTTGPLSDEEWG